MDFSSLLEGFNEIWINLDYLLLGNYSNGELGGLLLTLFISFFAIIGATILGVISGIGLTVLRGFKLTALVSILSFLRAIPVIMLIFWVYFLLPIIFDVDIPEITTVIFALSLIGSAYIAHAVHAGMIAVPKDQWQAAYSLGFKSRTVIIFIILPQAIKIMMPSIINQWVSLIKDSSLAYIVNVSEFTFLASQVNNRSMVYSTEVYLFTIVVYFIICFSLDILATKTSKKYFAY